jgi:hypothetical protein
MRAVMLLCDAAEEAGGKLFILGGGWTINRSGGAPMTMALAIKLEVPWNDANTPHRVLAELVTQDGTPALIEGEPVRIEGQVEVGRPPGVPAGTPLDAILALNIAGIPLPAGAYRWQLTVGTEMLAEASFRVV